MTDVNRMYRAVLLIEEQRNLHQFVWRDDPKEPLKEYKLTRLTFGVSASSFAANMAVKSNAVELENKYPQAAKAVVESFYVDGGLVGAETIQEARKLQSEPQELFDKGGFVLGKWKASNDSILDKVLDTLRINEWTKKSRKMSDLAKYSGWNGIITLTPSGH